MLAKNFSFAAALWKIPFRMVLDAVAAWKSLLSGDGGYYIAILKAHIGFIKWLFVIKKHPVLPAKKEVQLKGWYNGSVVWQYFIKKKATFLEIVGNK